MGAWIKWGLVLLVHTLSTVFGVEYCNVNGADGVPVFSAPPSGGTTAPLREDSPVGHVVYTLTASDTEYYVLNSMFPEFGINGNQVVVTGGLDYEKRKQFILNISAHECLYAPPVTTLDLEIQIEPVNEFAPTFSPEIIIKDVTENTGPDTLVASLVCTDADDGPNPGCADFKIQSGDDSTPKFKMSSNSIQTTSTRVDYEQRSVYTLIITAADNPLLGSPKTGTATVLLRITPLNDNRPEFPASGYSAQLMENVPPGTPVVTVSATDNDLGPRSHGDVTYTITGGNSDTKFYIDPDSGLISTIAPLDFETRSSYQLDVQATDGGGDNDVTSVSIDVGDVNDNPPDCSSSPRVVDIEETERLGTNVLNLACSDNDVGSTLTYQLTNGGGGTFNINSRGNINLIKDLDYDLGFRSYQLTAVVSDGVHTVTLAIQVKVTPVNEFQPQFGPSTSISVPENKNIGSLVYTAMATDNDAITSDLQPLTYSILTVSNDGNTKFWIDKFSGDIVLINPLDFESFQNYIVTYVAADHGNLKATSSVTISVENINDNAPVCSPDAVPLQVTEDTVTTTTIYALSCDDKDGDLLQYTIQEHQPNDATLNVTSSGTIVVNKPLDFENQPFYRVKVGVSDGQWSDTVSVAMFVTDVNEGAPEFSSSGIYNATLLETANTGEFVLQVSATDVDQNLISFSFGVNYNSFIVDPYSGDIYLSGPLDRETVPLYTLLVLATDGSSTSTATVYVNVKDVNEAPACIQDEYTFTTIEGSPIMTLVGQVSALDPDKKGTNGDVQYAIESGNVHSHFSIDPDDGRITIAYPTDYEEGTSFDLVVSVTDQATSPLSDRCTAAITIVDENDNSPVFNPRALFSSVSESAPKGTYVTRVSATDADSDLDDNNRFSYSMDSITPFKVHPTTGIVTVDKPLDRETEDRYFITVLAIDEGSPPQTGMLTLEISIEDINDNTPQIIGDYNTQVSEGSPVQTVVFQMSSNDGDSGENKRPYYSIVSGNYDSSFKIEPFSGYVQVSAALDRETRSVYYLVIKVSDLGSPQLYSTATATITISDVNDNPPTFIQGEGEFFVDENVPFYTKVGRLDAVDKDEGVNAQLFYKVAEFISGPPGSFLINETSGEIFTNMALDREKESFFRLEISVTDAGNPALSAEEIVEITVKDMNDNYPEFQAASYTKTVAESIPVGSTIINTAAIDVDLGFYSEISYELDLSTAGGLLADYYIKIHPYFGDIILKRPLDFEADNVLFMTVIAKDGDFPPKSTTTNVTIYVTDVNDNPPEFSPLFYNAEAPLTEVCEFIITTVTATDRDQTNNAELFYLLDPVDEQSPFQVNFESGKITARNNLNESQYVIKVISKDNGEPRLTSQSATVRIDTFQTDLHVISFVLSLTKNQFLGVEADFLSEVTSAIRLTYPLAYVRRWCLHEEDGKTTVQLYAVEDDLSDWIYNLHLPKPFLKTDETMPLFDPYGINADIWSRFSVTDVTGFVPPEPVDINPEVAPVSDTQTDKVDPLAVALPIFFLLLLLLIAILLLLAWKRKWCRKGNKSEKVELPEKSPSAPSSPRPLSPNSVKITPEPEPQTESPSPEINQRPTTNNPFNKRGVDPVTGWVYVENSMTRERLWIRSPSQDPLYTKMAAPFGS